MCYNDKGGEAGCTANPASCANTAPAGGPGACEFATSRHLPVTHAHTLPLLIPCDLNAGSTLLGPACPPLRIQMSQVTLQYCPSMFERAGSSVPAATTVQGAQRRRSLFHMLCETKSIPSGITQPRIDRTMTARTVGTRHAEGVNPLDTPFRLPYTLYGASSWVKRCGPAQLIRVPQAHEAGNGSRPKRWGHFDM